MSSGTEAGKTLYARLGGYDAIAAIVDDFLQATAAEPTMARFGSSMNLDSRRRNRQLTLDFICAATGGPTFYLGKNMKTSHAGLGITRSDYQLAMDHVRKALVKFKVPERESKELIALIDGLAAEIVEG